MVCIKAGYLHDLFLQYWDLIDINIQCNLPCFTFIGSTPGSAVFLSFSIGLPEKKIEF